MSIDAPQRCVGPLARAGAIVLSDTARIAVARYSDFEPLGPAALGPTQHAAFRLTGWKDTAEARAMTYALSWISS
ncbi:MAG: hypothetical protein ACHBNF_12970 [Chromatiales bacterium]